MATKKKKVLFRKPPLRVVLAQIRFPPLLRFADDSFIAPFQEKVADSFPDYEKQKQESLRISPAGLDTSGDILWRFNSEDGEQSIVLAQTAVTLESKKYLEIGEFSKRVEKVFRIAQSTLKFRERLRLGLRYINEFRHPEGATIGFWKTYLNPALVGFSAEGVLDGRVERCLHELHTRADDHALVVRQGLIQGRLVQSSDPSSSMISPWAYVLDMDCYSEEKSRFDLKSTLKDLVRYNSKMDAFFRWAIEGGAAYEDLEPYED